MALIILIHAREGIHGEVLVRFFFFFFRSRSVYIVIKLSFLQVCLLISDRSPLKRLPPSTEVRQSYNPVISCLKKIYSMNDEDHGYFIGRNFSITSFICFVISDILSSLFASFFFNDDTLLPNL